MHDECQTIVIQRSVSDVFRFLRNFENDPQWRDELLGIQRIPGFPTGVGAHYDQQIQWEGRTMRSGFDVTKIELDRRIEFSGNDAGVFAKASYAFESIGGGQTRLNVCGHFDTSGALTVLEPFMRALITRQITQDLESLTVLLNTSAEHLGEVPEGPRS